MTSQLRDFNSVAARWDQEPRRVRLAQSVASMIIRETVPQPKMRVLDFGCGTGLVTLALSPLVREVVAADSSQGMLEQLTSKLSESDVANVVPFLVDHEGSTALPGPFDLVVSSMTMHHIADVAALLRRFRSVMSPGGCLCIADLESEDGLFHDDPTGIQHHGFSVAGMEAIFSEAGFDGIRTVAVCTIPKQRNGTQYDYPVNLTVGRVND